MAGQVGPSDDFRQPVEELLLGAPDNEPGAVASFEELEGY